MFNWLRWLLRRPRKHKEKKEKVVEIPPVPVEKHPPEKTKEPKEEKVKLYPARNLILITSQAGARVIPCKINDDHTVEFEKKKRQIKPDTAPIVFEIPIGKIWPTFLGRLLGPRTQRYNLLTIRENGEMTHDPNVDGLTDEERQSFEELLKLMGKFAEVNAGGVVYEGLKGKKAWWDYIPYIVILLVVFLFLFAMTQGVSG